MARTLPSIDCGVPANVLIEGEVVIASRNPINGNACPSDSAEESIQGGILTLSSIFDSNCIESIPPSTGKVDVIRRLVQLLVIHHRIDQECGEAVILQLIQRESYGSSAIGKGLAFPHVRTNEVSCFTGAIGVAPESVNFESLDHKPTKLIFLTLSPLASRRQHTVLFGRLLSLMRDKAMSMRLQNFMRPHDIHQYLRDLDHQSDTPVELAVPFQGHKVDDRCW